MLSSGAGSVLCEAKHDLLQYPDVSLSSLSVICDVRSILCVPHSGEGVLGEELHRPLCGTPEEWGDVHA